jgi:hypothetical protein
VRVHPHTMSNRSGSEWPGEEEAASVYEHRYTMSRQSGHGWPGHGGGGCECVRAQSTPIHCKPTARRGWKTLARGGILPRMVGPATTQNIYVTPCQTIGTTRSSLEPRRRMYDPLIYVYNRVNPF